MRLLEIYGTLLLAAGSIAVLICLLVIAKLADQKARRFTQKEFADRKDQEMWENYLKRRR